MFDDLTDEDKHSITMLEEIESFRAESIAKEIFNKYKEKNPLDRTRY